MQVLSKKKGEKTLIKQIMIDKGITMDDLCRRTGKAKSTLSESISGNMRITTLKEIAEALGVQISDLFAVPDGYVHWTQKTLEQKEAESGKNVMIKTMRCNHCGKTIYFNPQDCKSVDSALLAENPSLTNVKELNDAFNTNKTQED